jgi:hypothetical protein
MGTWDTIKTYAGTGANSLLNPTSSGPANPLAMGKTIYRGLAAIPDYLGLHTSGPGGTQGPAPAQDIPFLVPTSDGKFVDPANGQTYADRNGQVPVGNVNSAQQTGAYFGTQNNLLNTLAELHNRQNQTFDAQNRLGTSLEGTINGTNPSVALAQLGQGQDAIARQQLAGASGSNGVNAVNAKLAAMGNTANAQAVENQSAALLRAQEIAAAQNNLGGLYNSQLTAENTGMGTFANTAANFAVTAAKEASDREKQEQEAKLANTQQNQKIWSNIGQAAFMA